MLSEGEWPTYGRVPLFGLPNADEGRLVVAGAEAEWWSSLADLVADDDRDALARTYAGPDGRVTFSAFFDLVAVHEVAHLFAADVVRFPRLWLGELFANLCLHAWVDRCAPESLSRPAHAPRLAARTPADGFERRTREDFERDYGEMSGPNYAWFEFRLQVAAEALHEAAGESSVRRLFEAFQLAADGPVTASEAPTIDDEGLAALLAEAVDPVLGTFSLAF